MNRSWSSPMNGSTVSVVILLLAGCSGGKQRADGGGGTGGTGGGGSTGGRGGGGSTGNGGSVAVNPVQKVIDSCAWLAGCLNTEDSGGPLPNGSAAPNDSLSTCIASWLRS